MARVDGGGDSTTTGVSGATTGDGGVGDTGVGATGFTGVLSLGGLVDVTTGIAGATGRMSIAPVSGTAATDPLGLPPHAPIE